MTGSTSAKSIMTRDIFYRHLEAYLDLCSKINQVDGLIASLDSGRPSQRVRKIYAERYGGDYDKLCKYRSRLNDERMDEICHLIRVAKERLGVTISYREVEEFKKLAGSTNSEGKFRQKVRGKVRDLRRNIAEVVVLRTLSANELEGFYSLKDFIWWYRGKPLLN